MTVSIRMDTLSEDMTARITDSATGYAGVDGDAQWAAEVRRLAKLRNATVLAHNYQLPAIQDVADHVGDSLALSRIAADARRGHHRVLRRALHGRDRQDPQPATRPC